MVTVGEDIATQGHEAPVEANAVPSSAAKAPSPPVHGLALAPRLSDANLPSSSSGNALAAAGDCICWSLRHACMCACIQFSMPLPTSDLACGLPRHLAMFGAS